MTKEIYIRDENDPYFNEGIVDFSNDVESAITQIRTILGTMPGEVLGTPDFGIDLEYLVFNTVKNAMSINKQITEQIQMYVHTGKNISISTEVNFGNSGHGYDYAVVDIFLNNKKSLGFLVSKDS